jgi:hypothetical protein
MPSKIITWRGQCPDRAVQGQLNRRITELAKVAAERFKLRYERYDHEIAGNIVLHASVFGERRAPPALVRHETHAGLYLLEKARLFGVEFRLPTLYARIDDNRVSFIFLRADDEPELDGFLVRAHDHAKCQRFDEPEIQAADWMLTAPSIHLRYAFEDWTSDLLAWVRVAYLPDLAYPEFDEYPRGGAYYDYEYNEKHLNYETWLDRYFEKLKKTLI